MLNDYNKLKKRIQIYLNKKPEMSERLIKDITELVDKAVGTGIICPFCESQEYIYNRTGKVVCKCSVELQRRHNAGW